MKEKFILSVAFLLMFSTVFSQKKMVEKLLSSEGDSSKRGSFLVLPAVGYAQEKGWEFGLVSLSSFFTDKKNTLTRSSNISAVAAFTTKKQSNFSLKPDIWASGNRYHYSGELRYKNFPFNFYGVGDKTLEANKDIITQKMFRLSAEGEKLIGKGLYLGLNAGYENYSYTDKETGGIYETGNLIRDKDGGQLAYLGISQIIDSRNTNTYTTKGTFIRLNYSYAPDFFGGENFSGSMFKFDFRNFSSFNPKTVLGLQLNYQTLRGHNLPFYLLPQLGNDQVMRGYYTGRYRDQNLLAAQTELRYRLVSRIGIAGFLGAGSVYRDGLFRLNDLKPSYGAGIRYFVDPVRGLSIRLDYAFGEKRPGEKRQQGFYLSLSEAF